MLNPRVRHQVHFRESRCRHVPGDLFMSLIHTCQFCDANPFHYLTELQHHGEELSRSPEQWMPCNYRETLTRVSA